jgi:hypothetical protein
MARVLPTSDVLRGQTSIGLYFSADWCPSCTAFTPFLTHFYNDRQLDGILAPFEVVLVSQCKSKHATEHFFSSMPPGLYGGQGKGFNDNIWCVDNTSTSAPGWQRGGCVP